MTNAAPSHRVLALLHGNCFVEVFAAKNIDVFIANRLHVEDETADAANLVDAYLEGTLPRRFRELYLPENCRATGFLEKITPEKAIETIEKLQQLRALRAMQGEGAP